MPSSTSSFERPIPELPWLLILGTALLISTIFIAAMEVRLARLGYHPTVLDTKDRWVKERIRASQLGEHALILIGGSRIQLGIDLDTLRNKTGLEPVQLAIDGSSFVPVLKGLADDPTIRGTVLIDYYPESVTGALSGEYGAATVFQRTFEKHTREQGKISLTHAEKYLTEMLHENLRSFADSATPATALHQRIMPNERAAQYLITLPNRARLADYSLVAMPKFYHKRVARNLGMEKSIDLADPDIEQILRRQIERLHPQSNDAYISGARHLRQLVASIRSRGGHVIFVAMPTSGMIREIDDRRHPRAAFLDILEKEVDAHLINSADAPELSHFACPDGSHLDFRDRARFTSALARQLGY